jgi:coenzyme F420-reducing hydrogenase alpha subunit
MSHGGFTLEELTKIEGHAKLDVEMEGGKVKRTNLEVYEASRYFESLLLRRDYREAPSITQRICGICSVVHTIASIKACEDALSIRPSPQTIDLRRLLLNASTMHSHTAHLFFFALPDYLGFEDVIELSKKKHELIHLALDLQKLATDVVRTIGGRALHPVTPSIGGFHSVPDREKIGRMRSDIEEIKKLAEKAARIFSGLKLPELESSTSGFCLMKAKQYPLYDGLIAGAGVSFKAREYKKHLIERVEPYSNAKHSRFRGRSYMVGALPRLNASFRNLSGDASSMLRESGFKPPIKNPFVNNLAQAIELVHFADDSLEILERHEKGMKIGKSKIEATPKRRECEGVGVCEAPRGLLFHHYGIGSNGKITYANVITPTSQNAANMESDIAKFIPSISHKPESEIRLLLEMLIRAYDPCFSCSAHFLELNTKRKKR